MTVLEKINEILKEQEMLDDISLTPETTFEELDLDSLSIADLALACEDEFDITIDLDHPPATVGELLEIIKEQNPEDEA